MKSSPTLKPNTRLYGGGVHNSLYIFFTTIHSIILTCIAAVGLLRGLSGYFNEIEENNTKYVEEYM